jgi:hypothetical protein
MKVFISWSGERSLAMAKALRDWLPRVIQAVQPWLSETDIGKGARWEQEIGSELAETRFGIICLTPENLDARWINFEAGALSKAIQKTYVCTYLLELKPADIEGPLSQFNHTRVDVDDSRRLIQTINRALEGQALEESIVNDAFDLWWPRLHEKLKQVPAPTLRKPPRKLEDMVEEILVSVRTLLKERSRTSQQADKFLIAYLSWLKAATQNDPSAPPALRKLVEALEQEAAGNFVVEFLTRHTQPTESHNSTAANNDLETTHENPNP